MARKHEAEQHLRDGKELRQIARAMRVSVATVKGYLFTRIGEGGLELSDLLFSIPPKRREQYDAFYNKLLKGEWSTGAAALQRVPPDVDEFLTYLRCRDAIYGDVYCQLRKIELTLHTMIRKVLESKHCRHDDEWWSEGVPISIRKDCVSRREEDHQRLEPYAYTTLIHLKEIVSKNWSCFKDALPAKVSYDKNDLMTRFDRLNRIRNAVMHPAKLVEPSEGDSRFIRGFGEVMKADQWRDSVSR